jgi:uncharacterized protein YaiE (UPF0345 family)
MQQWPFCRFNSLAQHFSFYFTLKKKRKSGPYFFTYHALRNSMFNINHYFDGKVASIAFHTAILPASIGVMAIGEFEFDTTQKETMTVITGALAVKLPGTDEWATFGPGEHFIVAAHETFKVKVAAETAYLCTYE